MVKSVGAKASSKLTSSKPQTRSSKPSTGAAAASSSKDNSDRPTKKPRVEIGGTTTTDSAVKAKPKAREEEKKPLKSALKNSGANANAKLAVVEAEKEKEKKKETKDAVIKAKKQDVIKQVTTSAAAAPSSKAAKSKRKTDISVAVEAEVEADAELLVAPKEPIVNDDKIVQDTEMVDVSTTSAPKTKTASKPKNKKTKQAPAPPLPKSFKVVAGSYEKLLYGIQGTVALSSSSSSSSTIATEESSKEEDAIVNGDKTEAGASTSTSLYTYTLKPIFIFPAHVSCIKSVAASPQGGKWLATGSADEIIKVWDLKRRKEVGGLMHHQGSVTTLTFPSRSHLLSASEDGTLALFRARDWSVLRTLKGHKGRVNDIAVHPSGKVALSVGQDGVLRMWDLMRGKGVGSTRLGGKKVEGVEGSGWKEGERVVWAVGGEVFAVQSGQGVDVYATNMDVLHSIRHSARIHDVKFVLPVGGGPSSSNPHSELLLVGAEDKKTTVYEVVTSAGEQTAIPRIVAELVGHTNRVKAIETIQIALPSTPLSPLQSTTLACTVSSDGFIHIYDLSPISNALSRSPDASDVPIKLEPVARFDTNKTRLTCVTAADGEAEEGAVAGKRKRSDDDNDVDDAEEDDEDEGKYGEADEHEHDDEDEDESGGEDEEEGEGEYELESD